MGTSPFLEADVALHCIAAALMQDPPVSDMPKASVHMLGYGTVSVAHFQLKPKK